MMLHNRVIATGLLIALSLWSFNVQAAGLGKAAAREAAKSAARALKQKLGPIRRFKKPTRLERYSNRPKTDQTRGLGPHSFWIRPERGPKGTAEHVRKELKIPHDLKRRETLTAPPGTRYHERPLRGGPRGQRELILHDRAPGKKVGLAERLRQGSGHP